MDVRSDEVDGHDSDSSSDSLDSLGTDGLGRSAREEGHGLVYYRTLRSTVRAWRRATDDERGSRRELQRMVSGSDSE